MDDKVKDLTFQLESVKKERKLLLQEIERAKRKVSVAQLELSQLEIKRLVINEKRDLINAEIISINTFSKKP
jgi:predicted nuclease with TOPRIM domain